MSTAVASPIECRSDAVDDPDAGLEAIVESALQHSSYSAIRRVRCHIVGGILTLRGQVPTYFLKQVAQSLASKAADVHRLVNRIEVADVDLNHLARVWRADFAEDAEPSLVGM